MDPLHVLPDVLARDHTTPVSRVVSRADVEVADDAIADLARRLGRPRDAVAREIRKADDPKAIVARLDQTARRLHLRLLKRREARDADDTALQARKEYEERRRAQDATERQLREAMTIGARLDAALSLAQTLATAKTASLDSPIAGSKPESKAPPRAQSDIHDRWRMTMQRLVENLEEEIDRERRAPLRSTIRTASSDELDRRLTTEWVEFPPELVAALDPEMGSVAAIVRARKRLGLEVRPRASA